MAPTVQRRIAVRAGNLAAWRRRGGHRSERAAARDAVRHVSSQADRWWLHVDLDVLDPTVFVAQGYDPDQDPLGDGAREIVATVEQVTSALPH